MFGLFLIICAGLLLYYIFRDKPADPGAQPTPNELNQQWAQFIAGYHAVAKTKAEKKIIENMLEDLAGQGFPVPIVGSMQSLERITPTANSTITLPEPAGIKDTIELREPANVQLDNASLLLYFGAFLFVASVGLFVAFGDLPGIARTLAVALVATTMYCAGVWLFRNKVKLEQAGLAFAGIGLATAPFVGLAAYNFVFNQTSGAVVWFITSLACMGLYLHALVVLKSPLLNYVLIFTFLSLIESGVSVVNVPLYYYGWGLAATGLVLSVISRKKWFGINLQEASFTSASLFMPVATAASVVMVSSQGAGQLAVSLLLASAYYLIEFLYGRQTDRAINAAVSQITATLSIAAFSYVIQPDIWFVARSVLLIVTVETILILLYSKLTDVWYNVASIVAATSIGGAVASIQKPGQLVVSLVVLMIACVVIWQKQQRIDAYSVAVITLMILPVVFGQIYLQPHMDISGQTLLSLGALLLQWAVITSLKNNNDSSWLQSVRSLYMLSGASVLAIAYFASPMIFLVSAAVVAISMILLAEKDHDAEWASVAGLVVSLPVIQSVSEHGWFLTTILIGLIANICIALYYRQELTRWLGTGLWFVLPLSLGNGTLGHWTATQYAWAYVAIMVGLIFARAIARGAVFLSKKAPLSSYANSASLSYVYGYTLAAGTGIISSLYGEHSRLHTSLIVALVIGVIILLAKKIERRAEILAIVPLLSQGLLLSIMRIAPSDSSFDIYLVCSSTLAAAGYLLTLMYEGKTKFITETMAMIRDGSLVAAAIVPATYLYANETTFMMPVGLLIFTVMLYHRSRQSNQSNREWVGALGLASVWWMMWFLGVRNIQAYSHVLAALFAFYAYWRHVRGEKETSEQYIIAALSTATIPLILQALGGTAGDVYGWWLLLEQIFFMLLGMSIGNSLVMRWGLYVSVGAVLYQLRNLGWAALTVLALFIIGLAVYRLQHLEDKAK